jgi:hypothetical protein
LLKGTIVDIIKTIEEKLRDSIGVIDINIIDESAKHVDHYILLLLRHYLHISN